MVHSQTESATSGTPASAAVVTSDEDVGGWLESLAQLVPTPAEFREETIDRRTALEMLRCSDGVIDALVENGLLCSGTAGEERFDRWDLFNVALYSRSRRSIPELSALVVARAAAEKPPTWVERREVRLTLSLRCTSPNGCADDPQWLVRRPQPERFDGSIAPWRASTPLEAATTHPDSPVGMTAHARTAFELGATVVTCGAARSICSAPVRTLFWEIVHSLRFQVLPHALAIQTDRIAHHGAVDCTAVARLLSARCEDAGFQTRVEKGLLLTMLGIDNHAWLEVKDEDGQWKPIDCSLAMISLGSTIPNPAFAQFCLGSQFNRVLPFSCPPQEPIIEHTCGGERRAVDVRVSISGLHSN
jgi:hypothetical protein